MESGSLTYYTPGGAMYFPTGSGGMINSNVLHMAKQTSLRENAVMIGVGFPATLFPAKCIS